MNTPSLLKILNRFFKIAAPTFLLLTFSFEVSSTGEVSILWRDATLLALTFTVIAAGMTLGWVYTSRRLRLLTRHEEGFSFTTSRKEREQATAPYNIFDKRMEPSVRRRMALAVFLTFSIIGPITVLMRSALFPIQLTAVLILTISSGCMSASFILFGHKKFWLVVSFMLCLSANIFVDPLTQMIVDVPPLQNPTLNSDRVVLTKQEIKDVRAQRTLIGVGVIVLLTSGYIMWLLVLNKEGAKRVRYQAEIQIAQNIQRTLLPSGVFKASWCQAAGLTVPATDVGGDYFDFITISDEQVAVVIADVAGHGIGAGILSAMIKSALRSQILHDPAPVAVLHNLNATLRQVAERKMFVTCAYVLLDWNEKNARIATAGHPPVIHRSNGTLQEVRTQSLGLGMQRQGMFSEVVVRIAAGDSLCMYTDGVTEAANQSSEQFGIERLMNLVSSNGALAADAFATETIQTVKEFAGKKEFKDDATIVSVILNGAKRSEESTR